MVGRLKFIGGMYVFPIIMAFVVLFSDNIQINGEDATLISRFLFGLSIGMGIEGFVFILFATIAVITGRFD